MLNKNLDYIKIRGAREHNLKNIDLDIPKNQMVVFTGISGSGKSSLVFDTIFAEGQRRYIESLSSYARQFLGQMEKPEVDEIDGLSPAISIDQKTRSHNPRSTVGTVTEIHDYLRVLFARIGVPHCPACHLAIAKLSIDQIIDNIYKELETIKDDTFSLQIMALVISERKGEYHTLIDEIKLQGFSKIRINGKFYSPEDIPKLSRYQKHTIEVVIDEIKIDQEKILTFRQRITESAETALEYGLGTIVLRIQKSEFKMSKELSCKKCGLAFSEITPRLFSFNSPFGACEKCTGLGFSREIDEDLVVPNKNLSIDEGGILPYSWRSNGWYAKMLSQLARVYHFSQSAPIKNLPREIMDIIFYGADEKIPYEWLSRGHKNIMYMRFEGIIKNLKRRYSETQSEYIRKEIEKYMNEKICEDCNGNRLNKFALAVLIGGKNVSEISQSSISKAYQFFKATTFSERDLAIGSRVIKEIKSRLKFLEDVGLNYLTLNRSANTLSGGESQRIRLASQIGSGLTGVLYVLDEPTIGLHPRDNQRLLDSLEFLRELGNSVLIVEHDEDTIWRSDYLIDIGPGAGFSGGKVVANLPVDKIKTTKTKSATIDYLLGRKKIEVPKQRRKGNGKHLSIWRATENNLKNLTIHLPLGLMVGVTGVSGSGKSTLINEVLYKALARKIMRSRQVAGKHERIEGYEHLDKIIIIDQDPIGRTPRSNPATYTGVFTPIRELFCQTTEARGRGYAPGRFSFNVAGGRCETCRGDGVIKIEMHFLPDVYVPCEVCKGKRFNRETLEVKWKGNNIASVLEMTASAAYEIFQNIPQIADKLKTLVDVGLGYIHLGQSATTLSGGEAQRIKLASELSKRQTGKAMYILDEPTVGLHFSDIKKLLQVLHRLADNGNSVVVIEHNIEVIKNCDWVIDLGPEGGDAGGQLIAEGTPEMVSQSEESETGKFLNLKLKSQNAK
ncbi:MAG: excinuclease ABC subunit UvrA [Patescibacteria group bacterium]